MKKKILYVYSPWTTFIKTDYDILSERSEIIKYQFRPVKGAMKVGYELFKQFVFLLLNTWKFNIVYIWFADTHSFLPILFARLFRKKSFLVIGGFDVARLPDLEYGVFISKIRGYFALYSMNNCSLNLTVSKYVDRKVNWIAKKANTQLLYNCIKFDDKKANHEIVKENLIITVGVIEKEQTFYIKGIDTFINVARQLPQYKFLIIGISRANLAHLLIDLPPNLNIKEKVPHHELVEFYQKAKIYCQLSRSESFGVALAEGMHFNCIPIVTNVGGMPEVVGNFGLKVNRDFKKIAESIHFLANITKQEEVKIDDWIKSHFDIIIRKEKLLKTLG